MAEDATTRIRGATGGLIIGIVLIVAGATNADTAIAGIALVVFCSACGAIFGPVLEHDELADI